MNILEALQAQNGSGGETFVQLNPDGATVVPGGDDVLLGEYARLGPDLQITLPDGDSVVVVDYFSGGGAPPALHTESGAVVNGGLVEQLAGPMVPDSQIAQVGTSDALGDPAGSVDTMKGDVSAMRGGVEVKLGAGDPIYEGDVLVTGKDSAVGIIFADDSTMSMGGGARISIDEMVYDKQSESGSQLFDIVQGAFVFASGKIGHADPETVQVRTPVATIGIRGTKYAIDVDQVSHEATVTLFEGAVVVENSAGQVLLNSIGQSTIVGSAFSPPGDVFVMDPDTQSETYGDAITFHPNQPQLREDDDGGGKDDGPVNQDALNADDIEALADELGDIDTAAGPSGAIAGFTQSALFLRLLNGVLSASDFTSGELSDDDSVFSSYLPIGYTATDLGSIVTSPSLGAGSGTSTTYTFSDSGGRVTYTYGSGDAVVKGGSGFDLFSIDVTSASGATGWSVGENSNGDVIISEIGGAGTTITMDDVEELEFNLGGGGDALTIGSLVGTDIAESTVFINSGDGNDVILASEAGKRLVVDAGDGDDIVVGSSSNDDIRGGDGDDILDGGGGRDLLLGEDGDDILIVTLEGADATATDLSQSEDAALHFGDSQAALSRTMDIVHGGAGEDTIVLRIDAAQLADADFVADLVALKEWIETGDTEETMTFTHLGLQVSGVEAVEFVGVVLPDASLLPVLAVSGAEEDGSVALSLTLDGDADSPLLSVSVTLSGVPSGAVLTAADGTQYEGGGDITLSVDQLGDLVVDLPADSDVDLNLSVSVQSSSLLTDQSASASVTSTITVEGIADAPIVQVSNASGDEDSAIGLSISVAQGDADGSETLTVAIEGLPAGAILSDADGNLVDPANVPLDLLSGLQVQAPANFSGTMELSVVATSTEGNTSSTVSQTVEIVVEGVADAPVLTLEEATGLEGIPLALSVSAALTDTDGSESLTVSISGLPDGFSISDGEVSYSGNPVEIPAGTLASLTLVPLAGFSGALALTVTAMATEANGDTSSVSETLAISLDAQAVQPVLSVLNAVGDEDSEIPLTISASAGGAGDTVSVTITGLPEGAVLINAAEEEFTGSTISLTPDQLDGLQVIPPANSDEAFTLTVTATATDGEDSESLSSQLTVTVDGVADTPSLTVTSVAGVEDVPVALSIDAALADVDGSETLTIEISGLQPGFSLVDASGNAVDPDNIPADAISGLSLLTPVNFYGSVPITIRAIATEENGDTAVTQKNLTIGIAPALDLPVLSVVSAAGDEDESIPLDISVSNIDGQETVTVTIANLPDGASLTNSDGDNFTGSPITLSVDQLDGLAVIPPQDSGADFDLSITVTTAQNGESESTSQTLDVTVAAKADVPLVSVSDLEVVLGRAEATTEVGTSGDDTIIGGAGGDTLLGGDGNDTLTGDGGNLSATVSLDLSAAVTDIDGSELVTITLEGLPEGVQLFQAGELLVTGGSVSLASDALDSVQLVIPPGTANFDLSISARVTDFDPDGGGDTASQTMVVSVSVDDGSGLGSNDYLDGGDGNDILNGGDGADTLLSGTGVDTLFGGSGNDILKVTDDGVGDVVDGGSGNDTLVLTVTEWDLLDTAIVSDLQALVQFVASGAAAVGAQTFETLGLEVRGIETLSIVDINGAPINLTGILTGVNDQVTAGGISYTGDGSDNDVTGSDYDDTMSGGAGNDTLRGGDGDDVLSGDAGDDVIYGEDGDDTLLGGEGDDTLFGGSGDDSMSGGSGDDEIHADGGSDTVDGGTGDDTVIVTIDPLETGRALVLDGGEDSDVLRVSLDGSQADLQSVLAEIASAAAAAGGDPVGPHSIESLGITFSNFEDVEIYVDGAKVDYAPEIAESADVSSDTDALIDGIQVLSGTEISDLDGSMLMQATVKIAGGYADGDSLSIDEDVLSDLGLILDVSEPADGGYVLVFSGDATLSDYETALASIRLVSDDAVPEPGTRAISVTVTDDDGNQSAVADVSVSITQPEGPSLSDASAEARDSAVFISAAGSSGAVVESVSNVPSSTTETLSLVVGKNGYGGTGQFEVFLNGTSLGTFTTVVKANGTNGEWETIEIQNVVLPLGAAAEVALVATDSNSNVLFNGFAYGDIVVEAETGATSDLNDLLSSGTNLLNGVLSTDLGDLLSDGYVTLDSAGAPSTYSLTPGGEIQLVDDWSVSQDGSSHDLVEDDLGSRFDAIDQGDGTDWAVAEAGSDGDLTVDLSSDVWGGTENVLGGQGNDILIGNDQSNLLAGGDGNDTLIAQGGDDVLVGGAGDDEMHYDLDDLREAAASDTENAFGSLDDALSSAYDANDLDGSQSLESLHAGVDGGSGNDTLKLSGGSADGNEISGDDLVGAVQNVEILDVSGVQGPVDMSLSVDDLIDITDDRDELTILKDSDDTVEVGGQSYGVGEHTIDIGGADFKLIIEETDPQANS